MTTPVMVMTTSTSRPPSAVNNVAPSATRTAVGVGSFASPAAGLAGGEYKVVLLERMPPPYSPGQRQINPLIGSTREGNEDLRPCISSRPPIRILHFAERGCTSATGRQIDMALEESDEIVVVGVPNRQYADIPSSLGSSKRGRRRRNESIW